MSEVASQPSEIPAVSTSTDVTNSQVPRPTSEMKTEVRSESVFVEKKGGYTSMRVKDTPKPLPDDGEVVIQVVAVYFIVSFSRLKPLRGINFEDLLARQGLIQDTPKSFVPGYECAGILEMVGSDVMDFRPGDRVLTFQNMGCCTRFLKTKSSHCFKIPEKMTLQEAAAFAMNYITAYILLFQFGNIHPGDSVLIHGTGGGVGMAALQLTKVVKDITVLGTAGTAKADILQRHGLTLFMDPKKTDYAKEVLRLTDKRGVDVILNSLGGKDIAKSHALLTPLGRHVIFGETNKLKGEKNGNKNLDGGKFKYSDLLKENKMVCGFNVLKMLGEYQYLGTILHTLFTYFEEGLIHPRIDSVFHVSRIGDAHRYLTERRNTGKVVLVWDNADIVFRSTDQISSTPKRED